MRACAILVCAISFFGTDVCGRIRNGYERQIENARDALSRLSSMLESSDLSNDQRRTLHLRLQAIATYIACYELTEKLLAKVEAIAPRIYYAIDSIRDGRGRVTDVFVKFVSKDCASVPLKAATFFSRASKDLDAFESEYGEYSVSIEVRIAEDAIRILCHEFGHLQYIIPNRASYFRFYERCYAGVGIKSRHLGHHPRDPSGVLANEYEIRYQADYLQYVRGGGTPVGAVAGMLRQMEANPADIGEARKVNSGLPSSRARRSQKSRNSSVAGNTAR